MGRAGLARLGGGCCRSRRGGSRAGHIDGWPTGGRVGRGREDRPQGGPLASGQGWGVIRAPHRVPEFVGSVGRPGRHRGQVGRASGRVLGLMSRRRYRPTRPRRPGPRRAGRRPAARLDRAELKPQECAGRRWLARRARSAGSRTSRDDFAFKFGNQGCTRGCGRATGSGGGRPGLRARRWPRPWCVLRGVERA